MATVIKAWKCYPQPNMILQTVLESCDGGSHYHLYLTEERKLETLPEADMAMTASMLSATDVYAPRGELVWNDSTDEYDESNIVRGEN